jgi:hypothetical protein
MDTNYTVKELNSWHEFKTFIYSLSDNWLYRGQSNSKWELQSSLERTEFFNYCSDIESTFLSDFQRAAKNFLEVKEIPENLIEWLALMQHHGAPTRLIDFTKSPYIASYFAFEFMDQTSHSSSVWAINSELIGAKLIDNRFFDLIIESSKMNKPLEMMRFEKMFEENDRSFIIPVEPFIMNKRYYLQQSVFMSPANSNKPFMEQLDFLEDDIKKAVVKLILPISIKNEALRDLRKMNITRASLFPDLDGYCQSLKVKYNSMQSIQEYLKQRKAFLNDNELQIHP